MVLHFAQRGVCGSFSTGFSFVLGWHDMCVGRKPDGSSFVGVSTARYVTLEGMRICISVPPMQFVELHCVIVNCE